VGLPHPLLERESELEDLAAALRAVSTGNGRVLIIEGPAGIGKTRLLEEVRRRAIRRHMTVLAARGQELEREFPYGVVRQLFEPPLAHASRHKRRTYLAGAASHAAPVVASSRFEERLPSDRAFPTLHGLYWLAANLAAETPIALTIDDVHDSDPASLRWLAFVAPRLQGVPILVALTRRVGDPVSDEAAISALAAERSTRITRLRPLSVAAVSSAVRSALGPETRDDACQACHRATGGNPFLLGELLRGLTASLSERTPTVEQIVELRPNAVARAVLGRLRRLPESATALAKAVALLSDHTELRLAATLAGIEPAEAEQVADLLARADILSPARPLVFVHPIVRSAIATELGAGERAEGHARAARLLHAEGAAPDTLAHHLVATDPRGDSWVVAQLRDAASWALSRGAPDMAAGYLRRALREPPRTEERPTILLELGRAENRLSSRDATGHLEAALEDARSDRERAEIAHELALASFHANRPSHAIAVLEGVAHELREVDSELRVRLERDLIAFGLFDNEAVPRIRARLRQIEHEGAGGDIESVLLADLAFDGYVTGRPVRDVVQFAERALADPRLREFATADRPEYYFAVSALLFSDRYKAAETALESVLGELRAQGSVLGVALASCFKAMLELRQGRLSEAEEDARIALEVPGSWRPMALATLVDVLLARGDGAAARQAFRTGEHARWPEGNQNLHLPQHRRGLLFLAEGRPQTALARFRETGLHERDWGASNPSVLPWRSSAAAACLALGQVEEARALAAEELALARSFGAPRAIGFALRIGASAERGAVQIEQLQEAARVLEPSGAWIDYAHALLDLGGACRRQQHRNEAREPLRTSLEIACRCGASTLMDSARHELRSIGIRARRPAISGVDAFTASERRVADLVAAGSSNREAAQALFVTEKTIETHLHSVYRKLQIHSRRELAVALEATSSPDRSVTA
jgi:DNA-binding CsgD family transcriptional regulator/tetratricopeptide (TPR) repeat protein